MTIHPDATLTLRQAFDRHYFKDELSPGSVRIYGYLLTTWERLSGNPAIGSIDDAMMADVRQAALDKYAPDSIAKLWQTVRAILRRVGPRETGNPAGLNIIDRVPYMRPVKVRRGLPRRITLDDLARFYVALQHAKHPRPRVAHPSVWWRALLVLAYCTGFRRGDLFDLEWESIDLEQGTVVFVSQKTKAADLFPLHPCAVAHLRMLFDPAGGRVFKSAHRSRSGSFYESLHALQDVATVEHFTMHDIRRTGASEVERVRPGMGRVFLQHRATGVTDTWYVNRSEELREAIGGMRLPDGFSAGVKVYAKREAAAREQRVKMRQEDFHVPTGPAPADWSFRFGAFAYKGRWFPLPSAMRLAVLRELVWSPEPVPQQRLIEIARKANPASRMAAPETISVVVSALRERLRSCLGLGEHVDPIPAVQRRPPAWWVCIPAA